MNLETSGGMGNVESKDLEQQSKDNATSVSTSGAAPIADTSDARGDSTLSSLVASGDAAAENEEPQQEEQPPKGSLLDPDSIPVADEPDDARESTPGCCTRFTSSFSGFLFPKVTPIAWTTFFVLTCFTIMPAALYIALFTKMGYGLIIFYYVSENFEQYGSYLAMGVGASAFLLYLFDCYYWESKTGEFMRRLFLTLLTIATCLLVLIMSGEYPFGPGSLFIVFTTMWLVLIQKVVYSLVDAKTYVSWLSGPLFFVALLTFLSWIGWTFWKEENEWNMIVGLSEADDSGCEPNFVDYPDCEGDDGNVCWVADAETSTLTFGDGCDASCVNVYEDCYNTFIIWAGPFLVSLGLLFLSFFASFLRPGENAEQDTTKFARVWMFLLFAVWVGASLAGVGKGVSTTLGALTLASFIAAAIFLAISFKKKELDKQIEDIGAQLREKYGDHFDIFRGLLIVTCIPVFLIYFAVSFVIQRIRSIKCFGYGKPPDSTTSTRHIPFNGWVTIEATRLLREFLDWNTTKVFTYAIYWGIAFMILYVIVAQFTLVFLSWLIEMTQVMPLGIVTAILVGIGMTMFLLPPVPGVPIYLTLGIVIVPVGRATLGVVGSIIYALGVSLCLKLLACTLQQKVIGGLLQHKVSVRQFCGVNSDLMRSMKLVLKQPGLGIDKVSILVGGPDWPTSVLCGIMNLDLLPILIGTLPVIFLITPTLLTGSFTYMANVTTDDGQAEFPWAGTLGTVCAAITALVQFGSMVVAAYFLEHTVSNRKEDLESIEIDEEVREADETDKKVNDAYEEITEWDALPLLAKIFLTLSLTTMIVSCYLVQFFNSRCFVEYDLTFTIDEHLDGDWLNIIKPLGAIANYLFLASVVLLLGFRSWAMRKAKIRAKNVHI